MTDKQEEAKVAPTAPDYEKLAEQILEDPMLTMIVVDLNGKHIYLKVIRLE